MNGGNVYASLVVTILVVAIVAAIVAFAFGVIDLFACAVACVIFAAIAIFLVVYVFGGVYYAVKQKDVRHENSTMTLDDVQEVDREMESKKN